MLIHGCVDADFPRGAVSRVNKTERFCPECGGLVTCSKTASPQRYMCDGEDGCGKEWTRYKVSTPSEREKNREKGRRYFRRKRKKRRAEVLKMKSEPCADCGQSFPPVCMDFDHVRGTKVSNISSLNSKHSSDPAYFKALEKELAKCELVCANCHRLRSEERRLAFVVL